MLARGRSPGVPSSAPRHKPGGVVVFEAESRRCLAAVLAGPHEDGTYDLDCRPHARPECIRGVAGGELVEYYSASLNKWIPSQVLRMGTVRGTFDLDCKDSVDLRRMRLREGSSRTPQELLRGTGGSPWPIAGAGGSPLGLQAGDHCLYRSSARGWIPARVVRWREDGQGYDLDVKQQVPVQAIHCIREGEMVEYHSASTGQWLPTRVLRKCQEPGVYDLECKEKADLRRIRPCSDVGPAPSPGPSCTPLHGSQAMAGSPEEVANLEAARAALARTQAARTELQRAQTGRDPEALQEALRLACDAKLPREELELAERTLATMRALSQLQKVASGQSAQALRDALQSAASAGVRREDLDQAQCALAELEVQEARLHTARMNLQRAARGQDVHALQEALHLAASVGLGREELEPAERALGVLKADAERNRVMEKARLAISDQDPLALRHALDAAAGLGLVGEELDRAKRTLKLLLAKPAAMADLRRAAAGRDMAALQAAIDRAVALGMCNEELEFAHHALRALEVGAQSRARDALREASQREDPRALTSAIQSAASACLPSEELEHAARTLYSVEAKFRAREELRRAEERSSAAGYAEAKAALEAALRGGEAAGLGELELVHARSLLQRLEAPPTTPQLHVPPSASFNAAPNIGLNSACQDPYACYTGFVGGAAREEPPTQVYPYWAASGNAPDTMPQMPGTSPQAPMTNPQVPPTIPQVPLTDPKLPVTSPQVPITDPKLGNWGSWLNYVKLGN